MGKNEQLPGDGHVITVLYLCLFFLLCEWNRMELFSFLCPHVTQKQNAVRLPGSGGFTAGGGGSSATRVTRGLEAAGSTAASTAAGAMTVCCRCRQVP